MVMTTAREAQPPPQGQSAQESRMQTVLTLYEAGVQTERIARLTGLSRRRVTDIVRQFTIESVGNTGVRELRLSLYADLQETGPGGHLLQHRAFLPGADAADQLADQACARAGPPRRRPWPEAT
jgi:hypothetical protein